MKLLIVRHGDPDYDIDSLTEKGWKEAGYLAERLEKTGRKRVLCFPTGKGKRYCFLYLEKGGKNSH